MENCSVTFSPDGRTVFSGGSHGVLHGIDVETGAARFEVKIDAGIFGLAVSPDGRRVAVAGGGPGQAYLGLHDATTGAAKDKLDFDEGAGSVSSPAFSPDGKILGYSADGVIALFDMESGREATFSTEAANFIILPDGSIPRFDHDQIQLIGVGGALRTGFARGNAALKFYGARAANVFAVDTFEQSALVLDATGQVLGEVKFEIPMRLAVSPDGGRVALGQGSEVRIIDVRSGKTLSKIEAEATVFALDFAPGGERLAMGLAEARVKVASVAR